MAQSHQDRQSKGSDNHVANIAIVGAGGHVGGFIANAFLAQGRHQVTAITRADSQSSLPSGIHATKTVDYSDPNSVTAAFRDQDALVITMGARAPKETQYRIIDAAIAAGVGYIMPNEYGLDYSDASLAQDTVLGTGAREVRAYIEEKGRGKTHWIALSCSFWYEFSLAGMETRYGFDFDRKSLTLYDDGRTPICTSTWPQCGRAVAALFALRIRPQERGSGGDDHGDDAAGPTLSDFVDRPVYVSSFAVSQRDMLASVLRVTGDRESDWTVTHEDVKARYQRGTEMFKQGDVVGLGMLLYARAFYANGGGDYSHKLDNAQLGLPVEDIDEYTREALRMAGIRPQGFSSEDAFRWVAQTGSQSQ